MWFLRHPYIINFYGIWDQPLDVVTRSFLVVEYCDKTVRVSFAHQLRAPSLQFAFKTNLVFLKLCNGQLPIRMEEFRRKQFDDQNPSESADGWTMVPSPSNRYRSRSSTLTTELSEAISEAGLQGSGGFPEMDNTGCVPFALKVKWCRQIADALKYLHTRTPSVVHGALRARKILLTMTDDVRVSDFSESFHCDKHVNSRKVATWDVRFIPPEIVRQMKAVKSAHQPDFIVSVEDGIGWDTYAFVVLHKLVSLLQNLSDGDNHWLFRFAMITFFIIAERLPFSSYLDLQSRSRATSIDTHKGLVSAHESIAGLSSSVAQCLLDDEDFRPKIPPESLVLPVTAVMQEAWASDPTKRPSMSEIVDKLKRS